MARDAGLTSAPTRVFGLTVEQLRPMLTRAAGEPVASFGIRVDHRVEGFYGFAAEKLIPTFGYRTASGRSGQVTVFVKQSHDPGPVEGPQYELLRELDAPIPECYGWLLDDAGREVLFLEYVDGSPAAQSARTPELLLDRLRLMGRFGGLRPTPRLGAWLAERQWSFWEGPLGAESALLRTWEHAARGDLGEELKALCERKGCETLLRVGRELAVRCAEMEKGLLHSDFSRENTGRRRTTGELLALDLEQVSWGPRFVDIAYLGRPGWNAAPPFPTQEDLVDYYLEQHAQAGGARCTREQFFRETRPLRLANDLRFLDFCLERALDGQVPGMAHEEALRSCREGFRRELEALLGQVGHASGGCA